MKGIPMGHAIRIQTREQYIAALEVLDFMKGTFVARGPSSAPVLFVTDEQYQALVKAGVISVNGKEGNARGKKAIAKKSKS
jgi:hypothetical protein